MTMVSTKRNSQFLTAAKVTIAALAGLGLDCVRSTPALAECTDPARPNVNWSRCYHEGRNLNGADLSDANLRDAHFNRADLIGSTLVKVDGRRAKFVSANLRNVRFDGANLTEADFTKADLTGASFRGANLKRARLFRAILKNVDLTDAKLDAADLLKADLSGARWTDGKTVCAEGSISQCK